MAVLFTNNAASSLASGITNVATTLTVQTGDGAKFPSPSGGDYFYLTLDDLTNVEVVKCTARTGDTLTVTRAQDGTTAQSFASGTTKVELRLTRAVMQAFAQALAALTAGRVVYVATGGTLTDSSNITTDGTVLTLGAASGKNLVVSSTDASTAYNNGCSTFAGGLGVGDSINVFRYCNLGPTSLVTLPGQLGLYAPASQPSGAQIIFKSNNGAYQGFFQIDGSGYAVFRTSQAAMYLDYYNSINLRGGAGLTNFFSMDGTNGAVTWNGVGAITLADGKNLVAGTTTGSKIGQSSTEKWGFWGAAPVVRQTPSATPVSRTAAATYGTTEQTMLQEAHDGIRTALSALRTIGIFT